MNLTTDGAIMVGQGKKRLKHATKMKLVKRHASNQIATNDGAGRCRRRIENWLDRRA